MTITYRIDGKIYINLTNRCSNSCDFCVRIKDSYSDYALWLEREPTLEEIKQALGEMEDADEVVFCGYGEPLYRLEIVLALCDYIHAHGKKTRINTNGQAKHICPDVDVAKAFKGRMDSVNVSLNASTAAKYQSICHSQFGEEAFEDLLSFAVECKKYVPNVVFSIVDIVGAKEVQDARALCEKLNVKLRVREYIG